MNVKYCFFLSLFFSFKALGQPNTTNLMLKISKLKNAPSIALLQKAESELKKLRIKTPQILTVINYQLPSSKRRFWVLDLLNKKILHHEYVAHGQNTGMNYAKKFSNIQNSKQSSLGVFKTLNTYNGKHGFSLRLEGLQKDINHLAFKRAIVMHGADYVSENFLKKHKRLGRSWGCPALDRKVAKQVIQKIKNGTILFAYF